MGQKTTPEHLTSQNVLYTNALQEIPSDLLTAACAQIIKEGDKFPWPSTIRKVAAKLREDRMASRALAHTDPNAPENFLARVKRVSQHDATWLRAHHGLLERVIDDHMRGDLSDQHLIASLEQAHRGLTADRQPRSSA